MANVRRSRVQEPTASISHPPSVSQSDGSCAAASTSTTAEPQANDAPCRRTDPASSQKAPASATTLASASTARSPGGSASARPRVAGAVHGYPMALRSAAPIGAAALEIGSSSVSPRTVNAPPGREGGSLVKSAVQAAAGRQDEADGCCCHRREVDRETQILGRESNRSGRRG